MTTNREPPPDSQPFRAVGFLLSSLGYAVAGRFSTITAEFELEPREFALLRTIAGSEGLSQQELGERLGVPASRMVALVDSLQDRALLERRPREHDRRVRALYLTSAGQKLLGRASKAAMAYERALTNGLSVEERARLLEALDRVAGNLGIPPGVHSAQLDGLPSPPVARES